MAIPGGAGGLAGEGVGEGDGTEATPDVFLVQSMQVADMGAQRFG